MNRVTIIFKNITVICLIVAAGATLALAQTGTLRGGGIQLNNGTYTVTLQPPSSGLTSYSMSLDTNHNSTDSTRWIRNDGSGNLSWDASPGGLTGNAVAYTPGAPQQTAASGKYLFYIQNLSTNGNTNSPGGFVTDAVVNGSGSSATGLTIDVTNTLATATGVTMTGLCTHAGSLGPSGKDASTETGITVNVTGGTASGGADYGALFNGGNVGISTTTPSEQLEVNGNIRISGQHGLKISEGTNATMGVATLAAGGTVQVNTSKVTSSSRIFLMDQKPNAGTPGTPYVSARTASASFTITSNNGGDLSDVAWIIIEP